jgi:hypothetical protein
MSSRVTHLDADNHEENKSWKTNISEAHNWQEHLYSPSVSNATR